MYNTETIMAAEWSAPGEKTKYSTEEVFNTIRDYVRDPSYKDYEYNVAVGTDSQMIGHAFQFISVISVHRVGKGGLYFYYKEFVPRAKFPVGVQKLRMFDEVARSCSIGLEMQAKISVTPEIHIDASPPHKREEFTAKFSDQLKGYVQSYGFECMLKPESYVAHAIADRHTKKKSRKRRRQERRNQQ